MRDREPEVPPAAAGNGARLSYRRNQPRDPPGHGIPPQHAGEHNGGRGSAPLAARGSRVAPDSGQQDGAEDRRSDAKQLPPVARQQAGARQHLHRARGVAEQPLVNANGGTGQRAERPGVEGSRARGSDSSRATGWGRRRSRRRTRPRRRPASRPARVAALAASLISIELGAGLEDRWRRSAASRSGEETEWSPPCNGGLRRTRPTSARGS